ncbi:MAG: hypothetical protein K2G44_01320 [Clostridia bacterium]|nr:hypothetical protein [Clostridia bacterium]
MNQKPEQLMQQYASCPTQQTVYEIDGRKYTVTRRFTGDKNINAAVWELAVSRANREMGL